MWNPGSGSRRLLEAPGSDPRSPPRLPAWRSRAIRNMRTSGQTHGPVEYYRSAMMPAQSQSPVGDWISTAPGVLAHRTPGDTAAGISLMEIAAPPAPDRLRSDAGTGRCPLRRQRFFNVKPFLLGKSAASRETAVLSLSKPRIPWLATCCRIERDAPDVRSGRRRGLRGRGRSATPPPRGFVVPAAAAAGRFAS